MKIKRLEIENFRCKDKATLKLGSRLTLLLGENGSGKTTFLDAIAIALGAIISYLPKAKGRSFQKRGEIRQIGGRTLKYARIAVESIEGISWDCVEKDPKSRVKIPEIGKRQLKEYLDQQILEPLANEDDFVLPIFAFYGVSRALLDIPERRRGFDLESDRIFDALDQALTSGSNFRSAFIWYFNKEMEELRLRNEIRNFDITLPQLRAVRKCLTTLFPTLTNPRFSVKPPLRLIVTENREDLELSQLSDGYKTMIGVAIDLSRRMAAGNPDMDNPLESPAIVMIDEVDLHLHPAWQQRIVSDLLKCFPNTQFIVTTHSPIIVEGINNLLKRYAIDKLLPAFLDDDSLINIRALHPLNPAETAVYQVTQYDQVELMDMEEGLTADSLIENFNQVSLTFEHMRELEWRLQNEHQEENG
ncbi:AAA family ATPase [Cyanobium sp. ATX 6F1]|uniref:AAA family ATPase n=1 Tax=unclassified Cyanobium TaxID=2627006 RepID=UPI0020CD7CB7|nr:AAA family ATPase [Cyanobium sp. ATX 6F1]MCP9915272.1 AAA family ATPase [Cyanobium sp. ATX 6F1]